MLKISFFDLVIGTFVGAAIDASLPALAQEVDLSPASWDATERSYLEEFNWTGSEIDKPLATGSHGAISQNFMKLRA